MKRVGGIIQLQADGTVYRAKGNFSYNLGRPVASAVVGTDAVHGYTEAPQVGFIEGEVTDSSDLDLEALVTMRDVTITLELANGKMIVLREAYFAGEGTGNTQEGNIPVRWEGEAEEVPA